MMQSLRLSLSKVLNHYPVLAGRIVESESSDHSLEVDVNSKGVQFIETSIDARLSDWEDLRLCPAYVDLFSDLEFSDPCDVPLLKVQVTTFRCGGIALSVHFLHLVFDGFSVVNFLNSWSQVHLGIPLETPPSFVDNVLRPRNPPRVDLEALPAVMMPNAAADSTNNMSESYESSNFITLRMEPEMIKACKSEVERGKFGYGRATGFEAVASMLWSSILQAREVDHSLDTSFLFAMDLRNSSRYPSANIPSNYFGNATGACQVHADRVGDVINFDKSYAASLIHRAKESCNFETVQSTIDWLEMNEWGSWAKLLNWKRGITSTTITRFPVYNISFGRPLSQLCFVPSITPPNMSCGMMLPSSPRKKTTAGNSMDLVIGLREDHRDALLENETFTKYFAPSEIKMWTGPGIRKALKAIRK